MSGTPPSTKGFRSRMGTMTRRSSAVFGIGKDKEKDKEKDKDKDKEKGKEKERGRSSSPARSTSSGNTPSASASPSLANIFKPSSSRAPSRAPSLTPSESSSAGVHPATPGIDTSVLTSTPSISSQEHHISPISESPLKEAAATEEDVRGRPAHGKSLSRLGQEVTTSSPQARDSVSSELERIDGVGKGVKEGMDETASYFDPPKLEPFTAPGKSPLGQEITASPQTMVIPHLESSEEGRKGLGEPVVFTAEPEEMKEEQQLERGNVEKKHAEAVSQEQPRQETILDHTQIVASPAAVAVDPLPPATGSTSAPSYFDIVPPKVEPFAASEPLKKAILSNTIGGSAEEGESNNGNGDTLSKDTTPRPLSNERNVENTGIPETLVDTPKPLEPANIAPPVQVNEVSTKPEPKPQAIVAAAPQETNGAREPAKVALLMPVPQPVAIASPPQQVTKVAEVQPESTKLQLQAMNTPPQSMPIPQAMNIPPQLMPIPQTAVVNAPAGPAGDGSGRVAVPVAGSGSGSGGGVPISQPQQPRPATIPSYVVESPQGVWGEKQKGVEVEGEVGGNGDGDGSRSGLGDTKGKEVEVEAEAVEAGVDGSEEPRPLRNPFDTPSQAPTISTMPEPATISQEQFSEEVEVSSQGPQVVTVMPLPPLQEVVTGSSKPIRIPSVSENLARAYYQHETDEARPLLRPDDPAVRSYLRQPQPQPSTSHQHAASNTRYHLNLSTDSGIPPSDSSVPIPWPQMKSANSAAPSTTSMPRLHHLGWIEYSLPDATVYYVHPTLRVTTDIDLRSIKKLDGVMRYLDYRGGDEGRGSSGSGSGSSGYEIWLRDGGVGVSGGKGKNKKSGSGAGLGLMEYRVNHKRRVVTSDHTWESRGDGRRGKVVEPLDDALDMEYRYWAFMEGHPAHTALPSNARVDAMDVLTWAWSDRLLHSQGGTPSPFTPEECQELMGVLRSFGDNPGDSGLQNVVHTRIVARIMMRVAQWRQTHYRPHKPLPQDVSSRKVATKPRQSSKFGRRVMDVCISTLFFGIPYLFLARMHSRRMDEENGSLNVHSAGPMLMVGACTCLVAAVVLSASVTFLSLPGLDSPGRVSGLISVLLATFSMIFSVVALFRYKADMELDHLSSTLVGPGRFSGEGVMLHSSSGRVVVFSLPLVLLIYSVISFITGIVLYSFLGVSETKVGVLQRHFEDYTRWTVVGVLGGLGGMLVTSMLLLLRR